jgi:hypothetical protein
MRTALLALTLGACSALHAQQRSPHARKAVEAINQLRTIGVPNSSSDLTVPPGSSLPGLLCKLKTELKGGSR